MRKHWNLTIVMLCALLLCPWQGFAEKLNPLGQEWSGPYFLEHADGGTVIIEIDTVSDFAEGPGGYVFDYRIKFEQKGQTYPPRLVYTGRGFIQSVEENELSKPLAKGSPLFTAECTEGFFNFTVVPDFTEKLAPHTLIVRPGLQARKSLFDMRQVTGTYTGAAG